MSKKKRPLTRRQELFAQALASGKSYREAYEAAYSTKNMGIVARSVEGRRTALLPHVAARIEELRAPIVAREESAVHMSLEEHLLDLKRIRDQAIEAQQFGAATRAEVARAKAAGIHVERSKVDLTSGDKPITPTRIEIVAPNVNINN